MSRVQRHGTLCTCLVGLPHSNALLHNFTLSSLGRPILLPYIYYDRMQCIALSRPLVHYVKLRINVICNFCAIQIYFYSPSLRYLLDFAGVFLTSVTPSFIMQFHSLFLVAVWIVGGACWLPGLDKTITTRDGQNLFNSTMEEDHGTRDKRWLPASGKIRGVNLGSLFVFEPWLGMPAWEAMVSL